MKKAVRKYPDRLADSCKHLSVNWMAVGSRLSWCIMDFFSCLQLFKHTVLNLTSLVGCRTWCPTDLQHLCCKALINWGNEFQSLITLLTTIKIRFYAQVSVMPE